MKTDAMNIAMAELISSGYDGATADDIRELANFALGMRRDAEVEKSMRVKAEADLKQLTLTSSFAAMQADNDRAAANFERDRLVAAVGRCDIAIDRLASDNAHDDVDDERYFAEANGPAPAAEWLSILRAAGAL